MFKYDRVMGTGGQKSICTENGDNDSAGACDDLQLALLICACRKSKVTRGWFWTNFWFGLGIKKRLRSHLQHSQLELQKGGQDRFLGGWRAAALIEILTRLYRNAGWKKGSHTISTTGQGYTGRRAAWLPAIWKEDKSNNKSKQKKKGGEKKEGETRDVQAGHNASDVLLFHWDWIRWNTLTEPCILQCQSASFCYSLALMCLHFAIYSEPDRYGKFWSRLRYLSLKSW